MKVANDVEKILNMTLEERLAYNEANFERGLQGHEPSFIDKIKIRKIRRGKK